MIKVTVIFHSAQLMTKKEIPLKQGKEVQKN